MRRPCPRPTAATARDVSRRRRRRQAGGTPAALVPEDVAGPLRRGVRRTAGLRHRERPQAPGARLTSRAAASSPGCRPSACAASRCATPVPSPRGRAGDVAVGRACDREPGPLGCCLAVALGFGAAMWSQLTIGWQWSRPAITAPPPPSPRSPRRSRCRPCLSSPFWPRCRCSPPSSPASPAAGPATAQAVGGPRRGQRDRVRRRQALRERLAGHRRPRRPHPRRPGRVRVGESLSVSSTGRIPVCSAPSPSPRLPGWPSARSPRRPR